MKRHYAFGHIFAIASVLMALVVVAVGVRIWHTREDAVDEATRNIGNFATILAEQASNASEAVDASIDAIIARTDLSDHFQQQARSREYFDQLVDRLGRIPHASVITVSDAKGRVLVTTREFGAPHVDLSDRDHFKVLAQPGSAALYVSEPLRSRITHEWTVFFAKRLQTADGRFLGIIVVGVKPDALIQTRHALDVIEGYSFALLRNSGTIIFRRPGPVDHIGAMMPLDSEWYDRVRAGGGLYHSPGYFGGTPRFVAVRPLAGFPFVVTVAVTDDAALGAWRKRSAAVAGVVATAILAFGLLLRVLSTQVSRLMRSREELRLRELHLAQQSRELFESNRRFDAALRHMPQGLAMYDDSGHLVVSNRRFAEIYCLSPEAMRPGVALHEIYAMRVAAGNFAGTPEAYLKFAECPTTDDERLDHLVDGRTICVTRRLMSDGGWIASHEDVTEKTQGVGWIEYLALHDSLTSLANRAHFLQKLGECARSADSGALAILLIDLDAFKAVNDAFGHAVGDALLRQVAERLETVALGHMTARLGGDEFAILVARQPDAASVAAALADELMREIARPYRIGGREITIGLCIGIQIVAENETDVQHAMRCADLALYAAKNAGRNRYRLFEARMEDDFNDRTALAVELREAIAAQQLELHYQPIVSSVDCKVVAMEALMRWRHPRRGMVGPDVFVPLAEQEGFIAGLGEWALSRACADALRWPENVVVAVNVSSLQIEQEGFVELVRDVLASTGLAPGRLEIEITESVLLNHDEANRAVLRRLRDLGVLIALDDFGAGYSSLSYLKKFDFDVIKIDKSFVDDVTHHDGCAAIIAATIALARGFNILTTAEGVETIEQYEALRAASVSHMQGYLFGKPQPAEAWDFQSGAALSPVGRDARPQAA